MRSGITRRWLCGSLLMTVLLVLLVEGMFLYSCTRSYYNSVQQTMYRRFSSISGQLKMYTGDTAQKASASRSVALRRMVEQFSDKDKYEFMLLDSYGGVIADFEQAQETGDGMGVAIYRTDSSEMVMAVCCLVPYAAEDVAAMRLVTSLTLVQNQLKNVFLISIVVVITILGFTVASGLYFVRSIVVPLGQVERTAASIARGELDVRLPVTGDARDEVDRLRGTINRMAEGRKLPQGAGDHQQRDGPPLQHGGGAAGLQPLAERAAQDELPPSRPRGRADRRGPLLRSPYPAGGAAALLQRAGGDDPRLC